MKRVNGYYWVRYSNEDDWMICEYRNGFWTMCDVSHKFPEKDYAVCEINETRILSPDEQVK